MQFDANIDQLSEIGPVLQVSRTSINLVENDPVRRALSQEPDHFIENRPSELCCRLTFFKPSNNSEAKSFCVSIYGIVLLLERDAALSLFCCRHTDVPDKLLV